ncbi:hypothetical protein [Bradyrhizobium sp. UFLA05-112]
MDAPEEAFAALKRSERDRLEAEAKMRQPEQQDDLFKGSYDKIWPEKCPSCGCHAFMTGDQTGEDISEVHDEYAISEIVDREFAGEEFRCPTCDLSLNGSDEIVAAGLHNVHEDREEREMEYEPDYGND